MARRGSSGHSSESTSERHEAVGASRQQAPALPPVDFMLWLHALAGDLGRNVDEWMRLHRRHGEHQD